MPVPSTMWSKYRCITRYDNELAIGLKTCSFELKAVYTGRVHKLLNERSYLISHYLIVAHKMTC